MRLSEEKIRSLAEKIYYELEKSDNVRVYANKNAMMALIMKVFIDDMKFEEEIELEVAKKLRRFEREISSRNMDYNLLFRKAKAELLREKGIDPENYL